MIAQRVQNNREINLANEGRVAGAGTEQDLQPCEVGIGLTCLRELVRIEY